MSTHQLALALFEELSPTGKTVDKAPSDIGFRKNNIFIDIVDLSLLARRAIDVAYFIVSHDPVVRKKYDVDLNFFKWLLDYNSNNDTHLRKSLREGQKGAVQVNDIDPENPHQDRWVSVPLLGIVGIANRRLHFSVPENLQTQIKSPAASHFLSLRVVFNSVHAKVIYDHLQPYLEEGCTPWYDLNALRHWLGCATKTYDEYRYLKRDVLDIALRNLNEASNLEVTYDTLNVPGSKKVGQLRFCVKVRSAVDPRNANMLALKALYDTLQNEFGLSGAQFSDILANREEWTDERLMQAIEYTRFNLERGKVTKGAAGYLMRALREHYVVGSADRLIAQRQAESRPTMVQAPLALSADAVQVRDASDAAIQAEAAKGMGIFNALPAAEQKEVLRAFCRSPGAAIIAGRMGVATEALGEHVETNEWVSRALGSYVLSVRAKASTKAKKVA